MLRGYVPARSECRHRCHNQVLGEIPGIFNQRFDVQETEVIIPPAGTCIFKADNVTCPHGDRMAAVVPIYGGAGRMGTFAG